jgi:hypothetical protein
MQAVALFKRLGDASPSYNSQLLISPLRHYAYLNRKNYPKYTLTASTLIFALRRALPTRSHTPHRRWETKGRHKATESIY